MSDPLFFRKRLVLAKLETTYGVDSTPLGANAILISNLDVTPVDTEFASRELVRPYLGNFDDIPVATSVQVSFRVEIAGAGVAGTAPGYGPLLRACGMSETITPATSVVYAPVSEGFESLSMRVNVDGIEHVILGARGSVSLEFTTKAIPYYNFSFTGLYGGVSDVPAVTPVYSQFIKPEGVNAVNTSGFSVHGFAGCLESMTMDVANQIAFRTLVGCEDVQLTDRLPAGSMVIQAPLTATKNFFDISNEATLGAVTLTHGIVAGNTVELSQPFVQLKSPTYSESDGIVMLSMDTMVLPSDAGNDEFSITVR